MYNRYVGNTGRFVRVDDEPAVTDRTDKTSQSDNRREQNHENTDTRAEDRERRRLERAEEILPAKRGLLSGLLGGGLSSGRGLRVLDNILPFGMDTGDLALIVLFFFLYIESGDDEFLIIMAFLAYSIFKDRK